MKILLDNRLCMVGELKDIWNLFLAEHAGGFVRTVLYLEAGLKTECFIFAGRIKALLLRQILTAAATGAAACGRRNRRAKLSTFFYCGSSTAALLLRRRSRRGMNPNLFYCGISVTSTAALFYCGAAVEEE